MAGVPILEHIFPIFRAHPLLFQFLLSLVYRIQFSDLAARLLAVSFGVGTIFLTYQIGRILYGRLPGALAALFIALMPYHVIVSRQVLLDGPMVFFTTLTLYFLVLFGTTQKPTWLYLSGASMGLAVLSKETSIVLLGAIYAFLALSSDLHVRIKDVLISLV
ncbi:glycosyltransferase family 39 protein, partial [bacterium]|nr:glycosyltransferase family 39 protein [bacterium]